jgi:hypothetical protein
MDFKWLLIVLLIAAGLVVYYGRQIKPSEPSDVPRELEKMESKPTPQPVKEPSTEPPKEE